MSGPDDDEIEVTLPADDVERLRKALAAKRPSFTKLVKTLGLDPARDFRKADLRKVDFGSADLSRFDFTGADLRGANLAKARTRGAVVTDANVDAGAFQQPEPAGSNTVFLAYARRDQEHARILKSHLESWGHIAFWDQDLVAGDNFRKRIAKELDASDVVLVLWSAHSVVSDFVIAEAEEGRRKGKLIPVLLQSFDPASIPFGFSTYHALRSNDLEQLRIAIERFIADRLDGERHGRPADDPALSLRGEDRLRDTKSRRAKARSDLARIRSSLPGNEDADD